MHVSRMKGMKVIFWEWIDEGMSGEDREEDIHICGRLQVEWNRTASAWGDRCSMEASVCPRSSLSHPLLVYSCTYVVSESHRPTIALQVCDYYECTSVFVAC